MFLRMIAVAGLALAISASSASAQVRVSADSLTKVRDAVTATGFTVAEQRSMVGPAGTDDLWLYTLESYDGVVTRFKKVFNDEVTLPGGWRIVAHARMVNSGDFNFTLRNEAGESMLLQVRPDGARAVARIEGRTRGDARKRPQSKPMTPAAAAVPVDFTP